jgi:hypothetical protein
MDETFGALLVRSDEGHFDRGVPPKTGHDHISFRLEHHIEFFIVCFRRFAQPYIGALFSTRGTVLFGAGGGTGDPVFVFIALALTLFGLELAYFKY